MLQSSLLNMLRCSTFLYLHVVLIIEIICKVCKLHVCKLQGALLLVAFCKSWQSMSDGLTSMSRSLLSGEGCFQPRARSWKGGCIWLCPKFVRSLSLSHYSDYHCLYMCYLSIHYPEPDNCRLISLFTLTMKQVIHIYLAIQKYDTGGLKD